MTLVYGIEIETLKKLCIYELQQTIHIQLSPDKVMVLQQRLRGKGEGTVQIDGGQRGGSLWIGRWQVLSNESIYVTQRYSCNVQEIRKNWWQMDQFMRGGGRQVICSYYHDYIYQCQLNSAQTENLTKGSILVHGLTQPN